MSNKKKQFKIKLATSFIIFFLFNLFSYAQNLLNNPESVVFDSANKRYLISNWGDGAIVQIDSLGNQTYFSDTLLNKFKVAGLYIYGDTLLAAAGDAPNAGLFGFNLKTDILIFHIILPDIGLPNDITSDKQGHIYVTDYWGDKLYKVVNRVPSVMIQEGLNYPNGLFYDKNQDRLLILSVMGKGAPVFSIDLTDSSLTTLIETGLVGGTDGITMDDVGNIYISEWEGDSIYKFSKDLNELPVIYSSGHNDPADIYFDEINSLLVIPNFGSNSIDFISIN
jgi:sugar lactone lactonase YvrE